MSCGKGEKEDAQDQEFHIITSTVTGGDWTDPNTWQEKVIPNEFTDVNITGRVNLKDSATCLNLMVDVGAHLIVEKDGLLIIKHHAINEGTIINNGKITLKEDEK
jgi:hypothetical protein